MQKEDAIKEALVLTDRSGIAMLGTNGDDGYPNIKAMIKMENEGLTRLWFSTNTSSRRVVQLVRDSKTCVYFVDFEQWMGLMLVGDAEVLRDTESKKRLWREGFEKYYSVRKPPVRKASPAWTATAPNASATPGRLPRNLIPKAGSRSS